MEEIHRNHKEPVWGWMAVVVGLLDGFPHRRTRPAMKRARATGVVTPRSRHSPSGWSA